MFRVKVSHLAGTEKLKNQEFLKICDFFVEKSFSMMKNEKRSEKSETHVLRQSFTPSRDRKS